MKKLIKPEITSEEKELLYEQLCDEHLCECQGKDKDCVGKCSAYRFFNDTVSDEILF